jgi:two-component system response regulator FlrC
LRGSLRDAERDLILDVLGSGASRREAADRLGISPRTLRYKLARLRSEGADVPAA